jgi:phosphotransferase system HPr (HPr) family protein
LGLHARAAAQIVQLAEQYEAKLFLRKGDKEADGSSILSVLTLSCPRDTEIEARAVGSDAGALVDALEELLNNGFGEDK